MKTFELKIRRVVTDLHYIEAETEEEARKEAENGNSRFEYEIEETDFEIVNVKESKE